MVVCSRPAKWVFLTGSQFFGCLNANDWFQSRHWLQTSTWIALVEKRYKLILTPFWSIWLRSWFRAITYSGTSCLHLDSQRTVAVPGLLVPEWHQLNSCTESMKDRHSCAKKCWAIGDLDSYWMMWLWQLSSLWKSKLTLKRFRFNKLWSTSPLVEKRYLWLVAEVCYRAYRVHQVPVKDRVINVSCVERMSKTGNMMQEECRMQLNFSGFLTSCFLMNPICTFSPFHSLAVSQSVSLSVSQVEPKSSSEEVPTEHWPLWAILCSNS